MLLALACVYFNFHGKSDGGRSTVHVASNEVETASQGERGSDAKRDNQEKDQVQEIENRKDEERKKDEVRSPRAAAQSPSDSLKMQGNFVDNSLGEQHLSAKVGHQARNMPSPSFARPSLMRGSNIESFGQGVPQNISVASGVSLLAPSFGESSSMVMLNGAHAQSSGQGAPYNPLAYSSSYSVREAPMGSSDTQSFTQSFGHGVQQNMVMLNGAHAQSFGQGAPYYPLAYSPPMGLASSRGSLLTPSFGESSSMAMLNGAYHAQSFGPGAPQNPSATSGGSYFTPSFVAPSVMGAQTGSFDVQSFGPVPSHTFNATSAGSQGTVVKGGPRVFKSCQARVNLWNFMVIDNSIVERGKRLGQGAYAEVYEGKVRDLKCSIKLYRNTASQSQLRDAMREIRLISSLDHPCTLRLIGWVKQPLQTITELCLGDLKDFYKDKIEGVCYSEVRALMLLRVRFYSTLPPTLSSLSRQPI